MAFSERLQIGDYAPFTYGVTGQQAFWSLDSQAGRPAVVIMLGSLGSAETSQALEAFGKAAPAFSPLGADLIALIDADSPHARGYIKNSPVGLETLFCVPDVLKNWRFSGSSPAIYALDRGARIIGRFDAFNPELTVTAALERISNEPPLPAPLLLIPHIFEKTFCDELIAHFEASDHTPGGMASVDNAGNPYHKIDEAKKKRRDLVLAADDPFNVKVLAAVSRVCAPELKKAFQFDATHVDRILIARYDDDGGKFLRHRDNADGAVAFRHFALSVNLNDNYEGGDLIFPEYNDHRYKPRTGCGAVFSASVLHEACEVTKGSRYVVLTFLHKST